MSKYIIQKGDKILVRTMWNDYGWKDVVNVSQFGTPFINHEGETISVGDNAIDGLISKGRRVF